MEQREYFNRRKKMSIRTIITISSFLIIFLGLLSLVGNVHVAEFYGIIGFSSIITIIIWFKLGKYNFSKQKTKNNTK